MKSNTQPGDADHWQIVGTVAHGNGLLQADIFHRGDGFKDFSFSGAVDDIAVNISGDFSVFELKHVGKNIVQPQFVLQVFTEKVKTAGYDANLVAQFFQGPDHTLGAFGKDQIMGDLSQDPDIEAFEQGNAPGETFFEVDFAVHGGCGNLGHLVAHTGVFSQDINHFTLDQGGIHIKHHQSAGMAIDIVDMKGNVDSGFVRNFKQLAA